MEKQFNLRNGSLLIQIDSNGYVPFTSIKRAYSDNSGLKKIITFSIWDDIQFDAYTKNNANELFFEFEKDDPLYPELVILLDEEKKIVIDDDNTPSELGKFMSIEKVNNNIVIHFVGNADCELNHQKFSVFIKNVGPDARSKIQRSDLKIRLMEFFRSCEYSLLNGEHQFQTKQKSKTKNKF